MDVPLGTSVPPRKPSGRRSQLEIRIEILTAIMEGAERPTQVMYRANLSWPLLCGHLHALVALGFLIESEEGNKRTYSMTEKGMNMVRSYRTVARELSSLVGGRDFALPAF